VGEAQRWCGGGGCSRPASGASTLLHPGSWLGGMVSAAGVCAPDGNEHLALADGLWGSPCCASCRRGTRQGSIRMGELLRLAASHGRKPSCGAGWQSEPRARWWRLPAPGTWSCPGPRLLSLTVERGGQLLRLPFEDAGRCQRPGRLLPLAGVPYRLAGKPARKWNEPMPRARRRTGRRSHFSSANACKSPPGW